MVLITWISIMFLLSKYSSPEYRISGSEARIPEKKAHPIATIKKMERKRPRLRRISI